VCVCVCLCVCVHTHVYVWVCVCTHTRLCVYAHVCMCVCVCVVCVCMCAVCVCVCVCGVYVCLCIWCVCVCVYGVCVFVCLSFPSFLTGFLYATVEELACNSDTVVCCEKESVKAFLGIEQVWVHRKWRRRKIATRLLDAARAKFCYGYLVPSDLVAFSQPTQDGKVFAERYTCRKDFLVYDD